MLTAGPGILQPFTGFRSDITIIGSISRLAGSNLSRNFLAGNFRRNFAFTNGAWNIPYTLGNMHRDDLLIKSGGIILGSVVKLAD